VSGQPAPSLPGHREIEGDTGPTARVGNPRLDQHGIRFRDRVPQRVQIRRHRDSHDPPDLKSGGPEPRRYRWEIGSVQLSAAKPRLVTDLEDFLDRLIAKDP
jgi:hypothetical protein